MDHALLVLDDRPTGAIDHLDSFISSARDRGAIVQQDCPNDCVLLEQGHRTRAVEPYLTAATP
jgi:hypothetical protein